MEVRPCNILQISAERNHMVNHIVAFTWTTTMRSTIYCQYTFAMRRTCREGKIWFPHNLLSGYAEIWPCNVRQLAGFTSTSVHVRSWSSRLINHMVVRAGQFCQGKWFRYISSACCQGAWNSKMARRWSQTLRIAVDMYWIRIMVACNFGKYPYLISDILSQT